jgi:tyrosyl-tRNA synthetase
MNTTDVDVPKYLKAFTLMELEEIEKIVKQHEESPELRYGQQKLASYATEMIFGREAMQQAEKISGVLFGTQPLCPSDISSERGNKTTMEIVAGMSDGEKQALAYETGSVVLAEDTRILELIVQS